MKSDALIEWHDLVRGNFFAKVNRFAAMVEVAGIECHAHIPSPTPAAGLVRARDAGSVLLAYRCSFDIHMFRLVGRVPVMTE